MSSQIQTVQGDHLARLEKLYCARAQFTSSDLTAEDTTQALDVGDPLPLTAMVIGCRMRLNDAFDQGNGVTACTVQIGYETADPNCFIEATDVFTSATAEGLGWYHGDVRGAHPTGVPLTGRQVQALFTTVSENVDEVINGDIEIEVWYHDLADVQRS